MSSGSSPIGPAACAESSAWSATTVAAANEVAKETAKCMAGHLAEACWATRAADCVYVYLSICAMELRNAGYLLSTSSRDNRDGRSSRDSAVDVKSPSLFYFLTSSIFYFSQ